MNQLQRAFRRSIHTSPQQTTPRLTKISLHPPKTVEVEFADGSAFNLSAEFLRVHSPAVDSKIRSVGGEKVKIMLPLLYSFSQHQQYYKSVIVNLHVKIMFLSWVIYGRRHVGIMSAEPIGNYGLSFRRPA
ncbi:uncharacterized protein LOC113298219 isoform X3 [Papaver somniferum]|uniref:uncharacterized protein LOC113298219 isoform X3 n=1 Tax=Papaver somniferum TaxID=3469 RepID=UPI000E701C2A|nr:uncharacterized protein LOC113298219 isoform X3 [Papaver somniferum]